MDYQQWNKCQRCSTSAKRAECLCLGVLPAAPGHPCDTPRVFTQSGAVTRVDRLWMALNSCEPSARDSQSCASLPLSSHSQHPILDQVMSISNTPHRKEEKQDTLCTPLVLCILQMQFPSSKISHSFCFTLNKIALDFWWIAQLKIHLEAFPWILTWE